MPSRSLNFSRAAFITPVPLTLTALAGSFIDTKSTLYRCAPRRLLSLSTSTIPPVMLAAPTERDSEPPTQPTNPPVSERIAIGVAWVAFLVTSYIIGPGSFSDSPEIFKIFNGNLADVNDAFFAIFNLVGVVLLNHIVLLNPAAKDQKRIPFAPCAVLAQVFGYGALAPYLFSRQHKTDVTLDDAESGPLGRWLESRANAVLVSLYALWAYAFALGLFTPGSVELHDLIFYSVLVDFWRLLQTDRFVFSTTIDCIVLSISLWSPLTEDMRRRGWFCQGKRFESIATALTILSTPGLGPSLYLLLRPRLPKKEE